MGHWVTFTPAKIDVISALTTVFAIVGFVLSIINYQKAKPFFDIGIIIKVAKESAVQFTDPTAKPSSATMYDFDGVLTNIGNRTFTVTDMAFTHSDMADALGEDPTFHVDLPKTLAPGEGMRFKVRYVGLKPPQSVIARIHNGRTWEKALKHSPLPTSGHKQLD